MSGSSRAVPVHQLHDDPVRIADLERALAPGLHGQRHGDRHALALEPRELALEVVDDEREDQPGGVFVALVGGQGRKPGAQRTIQSAESVPGARINPA